MAPAAGAGPQRHRVVHKECCPHLGLTHPMPALRDQGRPSPTPCPDTRRLPTRSGHSVSRSQATQPASVIEHLLLLLLLREGAAVH